MLASLQMQRSILARSASEMRICVPAASPPPTFTTKGGRHGCPCKSQTSAAQYEGYGEENRGYGWVMFWRRDDDESCLTDWLRAVQQHQ